MYSNQIDTKKPVVSDIEQGYILSKATFNQQKKITNATIIETNQYLLKLLSIKNIRATHTLKDIFTCMTTTQYKEFFSVYSDVAQKNSQKRIIQYAKKLDIWLEINMISPQTDYVVLIISDITDTIQKENDANDAIQNKRSNYSYFFNSVYELVLIVSENEKIELANDIFHYVTKNAYKDKENLYLEDIYPENSKEKLNNIFQDIKKELHTTNKPVKRSFNLFPDKISYTEVSASYGLWQGKEHIFIIARNLLTSEIINSFMTNQFNILGRNIIVLMPEPKHFIILTLSQHNLDKIDIPTTKINQICQDDIKFSIMHKDSDCDIEQELIKNKSLKDIDCILKTANGEEIPIMYSGIYYNLLGSAYKFICLKENEHREETIECSLKQQKKLLSIVAHDLKGPLGGCAAYIKELQESLELLSQDEIAERMSVLALTSQNVYKLLEDLLEWVRIDNKTIEFNLDVTMPHLIVNSIMSIALLNANNKNITIKNNIDENATIQADAKMLSTILRNLIFNAVKFTNDGGQIIVSGTKEKDFYKISVADNGIGMPDNIKNNLFKINTQVSREGTAGESSTGLGLMICKEYVERHGGAIWVESEENKGATFYFTIPITD